MKLRTVHARRYVTPLREGGSLPAIVEGDDDGTWVLKFRGAGQGARTLVAELIVGELARAAGLPIPELVFMELDAELARTEPDPEIQDLIRASVGLNLAMDWLPGSLTYDPLVLRPSGELAAEIVWLDAFTLNVDRTARNPNLLMWHRKLWIIDHGAALWFHHRWEEAEALARSPFARVRDHVLLPLADDLQAADARLAERLTPEAIAEAVARVPDAWLEPTDGMPDAARQRAAYVRVLTDRLRAPRVFVEEAVRARAAHL